MGSFSLIHWLVFGVIAILVLGGGRFSNMMGDVAKGIKQFKKGMAEDDDTPAPASREPTRIDARPAVEPVLDPNRAAVRDDR